MNRLTRSYVILCSHDKPEIHDAIIIIKTKWFSGVFKRKYVNKF